MAVGIALWVMNPITSIMVVIIAVLTIVIIYVYRTDSLEEPRSSIRRTDHTHAYVQEAHIEADEKPSVAQDIPSAVQTLPVSDLPDSTEELQQRIAELEDRVQLLKEELAEDPTPIVESSILAGDEFEENGETNDHEASLEAIQQLLETLEEKLAKGAISERLYMQLRDKYIARRKKTKGKRKASAKRGTKDSSTGD